MKLFTLTTERQIPKSVNCRFVFGYMLLWLFLSWLANRISIYDFMEATHWSQRDIALQHYWNISCLEAIGFSLCVVNYLNGPKRVLLMLLSCTVCCLVTFCYQWYLLSNHFDAQIDREYTLYFAAAYVAKIFRWCLSLSFWLFCLLTIFDITRRLIKSRVAKQC